MKRTLIAATALALVTATGLANAASWSVVVQPGVYGRVAIGGYIEAPQVYAPQPVVAVDNGYGQVVEEYVDPAYATDQPPVYLWVPEYQRTHWAQYCREYGAYGVPVYFVDDRWYRDNVMRRNWTAEQRSWNQQQWLEQDRMARDRFERQRFEQQRYEPQAREQQRWNNERGWHERQQREFDEQRAHPGRGDHDRDGQDPGDRMRWGSARSYLPQPQQANASPHAQTGNSWQQAGGQWQPASQGGHPGDSAGYMGPQRGQAVAPQPRGGAQGGPVMPTQNVSDRRDDNHGQGRGEGRGQGEGRGAWEHDRGGDRDR
jgi:hypothetical protein